MRTGQGDFGHFASVRHGQLPRWLRPAELRAGMPMAPPISHPAAPCARSRMSFHHVRSSPHACIRIPRTLQSGLTLVTWYAFLTLGWLYSSLVITAVSEWKSDVRRPISILIYGTCVYWLGPAMVLSHDACSIDGRLPSAVLIRNFCCWALVQLASQWFSFLDDVPFLNKIMFTAEAIRQFTIFHVLLLLSAAGLILGIIGWQLVQLYFIGRLLGYCMALVGLILCFLIPARIVHKTHYFHFHHYLLGLLVPFFPVPSVLSSIAQAILTGICIEGLSRWGPDPVFIRRKAAALDPALDAASSPTASMSKEQLLSQNAVDVVDGSVTSATASDVEEQQSMLLLVHGRQQHREGASASDNPVTPGDVAINVMAPTSEHPMPATTQGTDHRDRRGVVVQSMRMPSQQ